MESIIIGIAVALCIAYAVYKIYKKKLISTCSGSCEGCSLRGSCHKDKKV